MLMFVFAMVGLGIALAMLYLFYQLYSYSPKELPSEVTNKVVSIGLSEQSLLDDCVSILEEARDIDNRLSRGEDVIAMNITNSLKRDNLLNRFKRLKTAV